jgi:hypothetical protein
MPMPIQIMMNWCSRCDAKRERNNIICALRRRKHIFTYFLLFYDNLWAERKIVDAQKRERKGQDILGKS